MVRTLENGVDDLKSLSFIRHTHHQIIDMVCRLAIIDESYRESHEYQHILVSSDGVRIYTQEEFQKLLPQPRDRSWVIPSGDKRVLVYGCCIKWFNSRDEVFDERGKMDPKKERTAVDSYPEFESIS